MTSRTTDGLAWFAAIGGVLAFDAALIYFGTDSLSVRAGRHRAVTCGLLLTLGCHLTSTPRCLSRFDPLRLAATALPRHPERIR